MSDRIIDLAIPTRVASTFHYLIEDALAERLQPGSVVSVPFRNRPTHGFVLGFPGGTDVPADKLKRVESILIEQPVVDEAQLRFLHWVADYYSYPLGEVIATTLPRASVERLVAQPKSTRADELLVRLEAAVAPVPGPPLNDEQRAAVEAIRDPALNRPVLLHGVTGSGKTEVYMSALEDVAAAGKAAIVLVPEIALTPQLLGRFSARFPGQVAVLHSDLTPRERFNQWERVRLGKARIVVGARSAIFAPVRDLGLVVVDEEHEPSFKQDDSFRYHGRDVAVVRASLAGAKVVLGSATPSLESWSHAKAGKYVYVRLANRVANRPLPAVTIVDMKDRANWYEDDDAKPLHWLSNHLAGSVRSTLKAGQQAMLFLNRLGFAHFLYCADCGHTWRCKNCDVALTYYQAPPSLKCHYCGEIWPAPDVCGECAGRRLETMGLGTEQVERECARLFPGARLERLDRSVVKTRKELEASLTRIASREVDIIIGTQMIAKGHDFPGVALVGVLMADAHLNLPDFRAHERTFQIITQVAGRAGRAETPGQVVLQTLNPRHPVLAAAAEGRFEDFYRGELEARKQFGFPPAERLVMLRFQHRNATVVEAFAQRVADAVRRAAKARDWGCSVLGPAEAPLARLKNLYRWQCLVRSRSVGELQQVVRGVQEIAAVSKSPVQLAVDVDPIHSL